MDGTSTTAARDAASETYRFRYHGDGTAFFVLILKNVLLTIATVGLYAPWAKAARRRYIWSNTEFHGQRLSFTGTGLEMFKGYLKVVAVYLVLFGVPALLGWAGLRSARLAWQSVSALALAFLVPYAMYRARAYLLSRTRWRGIRLGLVGNAGPYVRAVIAGSLLTLVTLGFYSPWFACRRRALVTDNMRFGSESFSYDGNGRELFGIWIKGLVLTILTLGVYGFWMQAALQRYHFAHTKLGGARANLTLTGGHLLKMTLVQVLGTTLTLGLAFPWIATWIVRTMLEQVTLEGFVDMASIEQRADRADAAADGLADALDVGLGV